MPTNYQLGSNFFKQLFSVQTQKGGNQVKSRKKAYFSFLAQPKRLKVYSVLSFPFCWSRYKLKIMHLSVWIFSSKYVDLLQHGFTFQCSILKCSENSKMGPKNIIGQVIVHCSASIMHKNFKKHVLLGFHLEKKKRRQKTKKYY